MKKTFTTIMPDHIGAFLKADRILSELGLNITRVSYNKAVDLHMLFIEVEGTKEQLDLADSKLSALGYLKDSKGMGKVILMEFKLKDKPGTLLPVLELINNYRFNISFISSYENDTDYQYFKMGLFVENNGEISEFVGKAAHLCPIRIIDYDKSEKVLDNTVFYLSFANEISEKMGFDDEKKQQLIINSNLIMQLLEERNSPPYKTFDYIARFAELLKRYKGDAFVPKISRYELSQEIYLLLLEPPCGSNVCVIENRDAFIFIDSSFACYREEIWRTLEKEIPNIHKKRKELLLTHADVDHSGFVGDFDKVYLSRKCYESFMCEKGNSAGIREENPIHAPYVRISKLLSNYIPPNTENFKIIGDASNESYLSKIGTFSISGLDFEAWEGMGGHVKGETVYIERNLKLVFSGDIFVNIKGFSKEQAEFNRIAPYLMTAVDTSPEMAKNEREELIGLLTPGKWKIFGGHGCMAEKEIL